MKYRPQIDETDCGPACIVMVASHYRLYVTVGRVRELCKTDCIGTHLFRIPIKNTFLDHYIVRSGITDGRVIIWDSDSSRGKYTAHRRDFLKIWTGMSCFCLRAYDLHQKKDKRRLCFAIPS
ncbi:MAG: hypothetical protein LBB48_02415 [Treponema sp.]|jgi:ATP-binding cassette subfamily B protein|nr:hypothetical protein [Treponema sp.]